MLNHSQILAAKLVRIASGPTAGTIVDMNPALPMHIAVMTETSVGKEYYNLLRASAFLYQTVHLHSIAIQTMIDTCEQDGKDDLVPGLLSLLQGLDIGKRIATEGLESVAKSFNYPLG